MHPLLSCIKESFWGSVQKEEEYENMSGSGVTWAGMSPLSPSLYLSLHGGFLS